MTGLKFRNNLFRYFLSAAIVEVWSRIRSIEAGCPIPATWIPFTSGMTIQGVIPPAIGITCIANEPKSGGFPLTGHISSSPNGRIHACRVTSPFMPYPSVSDVYEFQVIGALPTGYEAVWIPVPKAINGFEAIRDPECAVAADQGNRSAIHPTYGRHYAAISQDYTLWPGTYAPKFGIAVSGTMSPRTNPSNQVLVVRQIRTDMPNRKDGSFACYEKMVTTGVGITGATVSVRNVMGCVALCLRTPGCTALHANNNIMGSGLVQCELRNGAFVVQNGTANVDIACVLQI